MILIVDFGGHNNQLAARKIRDLKVYCEVHPYNKALSKLKELSPSGVVFQGEPDKFKEFKEIEKEVKAHSLPSIKISEGHVEDLREKLSAFLFDTCKEEPTWTMKNFKEQQIEEIKKTVGDKKVLLALSGGVDSSVVAALLSKAVGKNLTCIFVDTGLMRKHEGDQVEEAFKDSGMNFIRINAEERYLNKLKGVTDPEKKRKIIGEEFIRVFEEEGKKIGHVDYLGQGTIYPDIIESGLSDGKVVKSHHNVGGLPEAIDFEDLIEPLKFLFKDEVRELGRELELPDYLVTRQPFPGPGLGVRCMGEITKDKLDILRDADYIFREELEKNMDRSKMSQYFAILTNQKTVGVSKDSRTYDYTIALRCIKTTDFMSADWVKIPYEILEQASTRILNEVDHVNRVVYDITSKPPATIEWE